MQQDLFFLVLAFILILANAFFVGTEAALVRVRLTRLDELAANGNSAALRARDIAGRIGEYMSACQLGITLASLGLGWIGEEAFASIVKKILHFVGLEHRFWVYTFEVVFVFVLITFLHIVLGELVPKWLALQYSEEVALAISWPLNLFFRMAHPFIRVLNWSGEFIVRLMGLQLPQEGKNAHSTEELRLMLHESHRSGTLTLAERELLENAFDFSDRTVRQVMRPRGEISYLSMQEPLDKSMERARKNGYTRYPVCEDDVDHVLGLVHVKDLLWPTVELKTPQDMLKIKRDILFVPEMIGIPALLTEMRRKKVLMAIAVDEYGVVSGICTMEDILEELVGEIQDEFDQENPEIRPTKDGGFLLEGTVLIEDLNRRLMMNIRDAANDTVSGHILSRLGRMATAGDSLTMDNYLVRIVEVKGLRISKLLFTPISPRAAGDPAAMAGIVSSGGHSDASSVAAISSGVLPRPDRETGIAPPGGGPSSPSGQTPSSGGDSPPRG